MHQSAFAETRLSGYSSGVNPGRSHAKALSAALARFGGTARAAVDAAAVAGDAGAAGLFHEVAQGADRLLGKIEAHARARHYPASRPREKKS